MKIYILLLSLLGSVSYAAEKVTLVSAYSTMSSKRQKHEIMLSNGTFIVLQSSLVDNSDVKVTVSQRPVPIPFEEEGKSSVLQKRPRSRSQSRPESPLARPGEQRSKSR
jgi:hypothetical protein